MPGMSQRPLHLVAHTPTAELERLYKAATTVIERSHLHIIWLLSRGFAAKLVADVTGFTQRWISELVGRYNQFGLDGLGDHRRFNAGAKPLLDQGNLVRLRHWLDGEPPGHGLWTGRKVAQWITGTIGRLVSPRRGLDYPAPARLHPPDAPAAPCRGQPLCPGRLQGRLPAADPGPSARRSRYPARGLGARRAPDRAEAGGPPHLGAPWLPAGRARPPSLGVAVPVRFRPARDRRSFLGRGRRREHGPVQQDPGRLRPRGRRRCAQARDPRARRGRLAYIRGPGNPGGHRTDVPAAVLARTSAGRVPVAADRRGDRQPPFRDAR